DTALDLSLLLDKGLFRDQLISSTFVQSEGRDHYMIKVVLENGGEHNWNMQDLRMWSQDGLITLTKNRTLVFPKLDSNEYVVLDKNRFAQQVLRSRVYQRKFEGTDILAGQVIAFAVRDFNMLSLLDIKPGRDEHGYLHMYALDLTNGERLFLSYRQAMEALQRGAFQDEVAGGRSVQDKPYLLQEIRRIPLKRFPESGTGRFGVELVFDREVTLEASQFPFRIYEDSAQERRPRLDNPFVIEFTAPNALITKPPAGVEHNEFLTQVSAANDRLNPMRVLLKAQMEPHVLNVAPQVEVEGARVRLLFTKVDDQTIFDRKALEQAELKRRQERLIAGSLSQEDVERHNVFRQHMETGLGQMDRTRAESRFEGRMEILRSAMANFKEAALYASSDLQLEEALAQRNTALNRMAALIMRRVRDALKAGDKDTAALQSQIGEAKLMATAPELMEELRKMEFLLKAR
ncbi:MAG: hypothetical protein OEW39_15010, partial [Deltaproteobacteria bacterium]|nr:hypothetical protein [Deltaproteobacteria bacterium]